MALIRLSGHPHQAGVVLLDVPPDAADDLRKQFPPARRTGTQSWQGNFAISDDALAGLRAWAAHAGHQLLDERTDTEHDGERLHAIECGNVVRWLTTTGQEVDAGTPGAVPEQCSTPIKATSVPKRCPGCGQRPKINRFIDVAPIITTATCPRCAAGQTGRFPYCANCGAAMHHPKRAVRKPVIPAQPRVRLDDPVPISAAVDFGELDGERLRAYQRRIGTASVVGWDAVGQLTADQQERPIEDVALPDPGGDVVEALVAANDPALDDEVLVGTTTGEIVERKAWDIDDDDRPTTKALKRAIARSIEKAAER